MFLKYHVHQATSGRLPLSSPGGYRNWRYERSGGGSCGILIPYRLLSPFLRLSQSFEWLSDRFYFLVSLSFLGLLDSGKDVGDEDLMGRSQTALIGCTKSFYTKGLAEDQQILDIARVF